MPRKPKPAFDVDRVEFDKVQKQLEAMHEEIGHLSKKKPDGAVNKFKLGHVNQLLIKANGLLLPAYKPFENFSTFDEDDLPTSSDVVMILAQYLGCFAQQSSAMTLADLDLP